MLRETVLHLRNVAREMPWFAEAVLLSVALCVGVNASVLGEARQALVADTLDRFQIVGKKDLYPHQLSGGQQQLGWNCASDDSQARVAASR